MDNDKQKEISDFRKDLPVLFQDDTGKRIVSLLYNEDTFEGIDIPLIYSYFEEKLHLHSNLESHFDGVYPLKKTLLTYLLVYDTYKDKDKLKEIFRKKLSDIGVFNDKEILEFLLLIAERVRHSEINPENMSVEEIGKHYFDMYKGQEEKRSHTSFSFSLEHSHSYQTDKIRRIEETAIDMIVHSRSDFLYILPMSDKDSQEIREIDQYFQEAFVNYFGRKAPLSLCDSTNFSSDFHAPYADKISGKTFIDKVENNKNKIAHAVIHEGMHVCFDGFNEEKIEEGLIEYFIEKMYKMSHSDVFVYTPISDVYANWKNIIKILCEIDPDLEKHFIQYFLGNDRSPLIDQIKKNFTDEKIEEIERNNYYTNINQFMNQLKSFRDSFY